MYKQTNDSENVILKSYFKQIKAIPLLSAEEEIALAKKIQSGSESAKKRLTESNLRLVVKICRAYNVKDIPLMDLIQEGNIGLMHACGKFDIEKNVRFSTYAALWIKQAITRFLETKRRAIHLPIQKEDLIRKIGYAESNLRQLYGRSPQSEEIAAEIGCTKEEIDYVAGISDTVFSLESELDKDGGTTFGEICEDKQQQNPEHEYLVRCSDVETRCFLKRHLDKRERTVILQRFRFHQNGHHTFKKIGEEMGLSAEAVRQIEKRALNKIKLSYNELADCVYA
ncbi:MAG: RNA polymerase sigma factor RpoD/SigA [Spirochaetaceae bacterium]|nr:RNA polymerase sigma factor RpoD/SigA [Spirochaetaceae bacterium]